MKKILLIGESCIDVFKYGDCYRLNPEAPTPVLVPSKEVTNDGMAANVKHNLEFLLNQKIDFVTNKEIIEKVRFVDDESNYILLRVDNDNKIKQLTIDEINIKIPLPLNNYDLIIVSDYNKGLISDDVLKYIIDNSKISFVDTKRVISDWAENVTYLKINEKESVNEQHKDLLLTPKFFNKTIVTMGKYGCKLGDTIIGCDSVDVRDVAGAGDTFLSAVASKYLMCGDIITSMEFANKCASYVVSQKGVTLPKCRV